MSMRTLAYPVAFLTLSALILPSHVAAQAAAPRPARPAAPQLAPPPQPPQPPPPPPAPEPRELANIRVEVSIRSAGDPPYSKTFKLTVGDRGSAQIRGDRRGGGGSRFLHVDARPRITDGKIRLNLTFEHDLPDLSGSAPQGSVTNTLTENLDVVLESGKPLVVGEHLDAASNRPVTVEVTATILR